ncbi:hypothetical protein [Rubrivirga sp.]|uniref:hypothetical protein n=1 Tax=Rubrivirga sp. TaxID=1885344 RepID=UPI003B522E4C
MRTLAFAAVLVAVASGCAPPSPVAPTEPAGPGALRLTAEARAERDSLYADLRVTNTSDRPVAVGYGACSATVLGWPDSRRAGPPAFTTAFARTVDGYSIGCPLYLATRTLAPGETMTPDGTPELRVAASLAEVLTDSIPDGRYWLTAVFDVDMIDGTRPVDTLRVDLGPVDLAARRPPLATEAVRVGVRFGVDSVRVEGGRLRAVVRAAPVPRMGPDVVGWAPCAARVLAFAGADRRDAAPRAGPPEATADAACGQPPPTPFGGSSAGGGSPPLYLGIDRALRAEVDLALEDLLGDRPPGRYALAVAARTLSGPYELRSLPPVHLTLGEVDWRP